MAVALVVDDSMLIRHTVCRYLEKRGWEVDLAVDGAEAIKMLEARRPNLIVTDVSLPGMSGTELIAELKKHPATAAIPVIILCGRDSEPEARANESRAQCAIYKDIDILAQLDRAVETAMSAAALSRPRLKHGRARIQPTGAQTD